MLPRQQLSGWRPCFSDMTLTLATFSIYIQRTVIPGKHIHQFKEVSTVRLLLDWPSSWPRNACPWRGTLVHLTMLVMCISVLECCLFFSRAAFDFLMPSIVYSVVFILLFKKEKPTTKTVDWISSGRVFPATHSQKPLFLEWPPLSIFWVRHIWLRWAYTAAHWNVAVIALDMKCVNMWSICWILLNSYLFNCVITYSCFNMPFLFSLILVIREHCFCFWTCCCTGLCFIYIFWGFISLIFQAGRCPGQAGPIAGQNWAASLL